MKEEKLTFFLLSEGSRRVESQKTIDKSQVVLECIYGPRSALIHGHQTTHIGLLSSGASLSIDPYLKFYAQLYLSEQISLSLQSLACFLSSHLFFNLTSVPSSILPVIAFPSFLGYGLSLQSLPCHDCAHYLTPWAFCCNFPIHFPLLINFTICFSVPVPRWLGAVDRGKAHEGTGVASNFSQILSAAL